jgi:hypothetical protein
MSFPYPFFIQDQRHGVGRRVRSPRFFALTKVVKTRLLINFDYSVARL